MALVVPPLLGACEDAVFANGPGWGLTAGAAVGAVISTILSARRGALWWMVPLPVLVVAAITAGAGMLSGSGGKPLTTELLRWAVAGFPAMAAAECAVLAVLAVHGLQSLRARRRHDA
ncbi:MULTISPECIES: hypothetical protein [unclassified Streptomyces]|uniref:hypothetical protein n=1 Tax=unclassified Streptomyces TaxID=2593676 RepID=UPI003800F238